MTYRATAQSLSSQCPPDLRALLDRVNYSYRKAGALAGLTSASIGGFARGQNKPSPDSAAKIHDALTRYDRGQTEPLAGEITAQGDGKLGVAVVYVGQDKIAILTDSLQILGGQCSSKRQMHGGRWSMVVKFSSAPRLLKFRAIAQALGVDIVTP
jgi:hypothetical protein